MLCAALYIASYKQNIDKTRLAGCQDRRELTPKIWVEAMFFRFKNPFCLFANSASYTKLPNSPDFTHFYWIIADSTKIF